MLEVAQLAEAGQTVGAFNNCLSARLQLWMQKQMGQDPGSAATFLVPDK